MIHSHFSSINQAHPKFGNQRDLAARQEIMRIHEKVFHCQELTPEEDAKFMDYIREKQSTEQRLTCTEKAYLNKTLDC